MALPQGCVCPSAAVASLDELARKGRSFSVLCALGRADPVNMSQFTKASHLVPDRAKVLREDLKAHGLIDVSVVRVQGPAEILDIRLTPLGREVAKRLVEVDDLLKGTHGSDRGRKRRGDER
jgi:DNA-binding HxlR family transcriptional regulator